MNNQGAFIGFRVQPQADIVTEVWMIVFQRQNIIGFRLDDLFREIVNAKIPLIMLAYCKIIGMRHETNDSGTK